MELATARFPFPPEGQAPLPSVLDLLRYIEEEPAPTFLPGRFSEDFEKFIALWYEEMGDVTRLTSICLDEMAYLSLLFLL